MSIPFAPIAELAAAQHGVVTRSQLLSLGATSSQIKRLTAAGKLHARYRAVFAVGHPRLSMHGEWSAAVLASGDGAALAGHAAAALWRIGRRRVKRVEVATPTLRRRRLVGVDLTCASRLAERSVVVDGIRVLSVAWTIAWLADSVPKGELVKLVSQAAFRRVLDLDELLRIAHDGSRRRGAAKLRAALRAYLLHDEHGSDSALEERVLSWLPVVAEAPRQNVWVPAGEERYRLDIAYERLRIDVEADGPHHQAPAVARVDARRDRMLRRAGWQVIRIRQADFDRDPYGATEPAREAILAAAACALVRYADQSAGG